MDDFLFFDCLSSRCVCWSSAWLPVTECVPVAVRAEALLSAQQRVRVLEQWLAASN